MEFSAKIEFIKANLKQSVVLVGLMGAGKTSIGQALGHALGCSFVDSDAVIIEEHGSITNIFRDQGEPRFREIERNTIQNLILKEDAAGVLGTGGGAFMNDETRALIKEKAISIFLSAGLDVLVERVGNGEGRPLFKDKEPRTVLADFISKRYPTYALADLSVETRHEGEQETLHRVIDSLYTHLKR